MTEFNPYAPPKADIEPSPLDVDLDLDSLPLASRTARLGGAIIDGVIAIVVVMPVLFATGVWNAMWQDQLTTTQSLLIAGGEFLAFLLVQGYLLATRGQTVGKLLVGTRIVAVDRDEILPFGKLIGLRYLPFSVVGNLPIIGMAGIFINILFIFRRDKRCLHDHLAGTRVIRDARIGAA